MLKLHLYFGKKDTDLIQWKDSLPNNKLTYYIIMLCQAEINHSFIKLPPMESFNNHITEIKPYDTIIAINNMVVEQYLKMISPYQRNSVIKGIIRKNIQASSGCQFDVFVPITQDGFPSAENNAKKQTKTQKQSPKKTNTKPISISYTPQNKLSNKSETREPEKAETTETDFLKSALLRMAGE